MNVRKMKLTQKWIVSILAVTAVLFAATSCLDDDDDPVVVPVAFVSLYHGSPDAPHLDIEVDNRQINFNPFEYTQYSGYLRFYTGDRNLRFGPYAASNTVLDTTVNFEPDKAYSVFVVDEYEDASIVVLNDNSDAPSTGNAKLRVINLAPDAHQFDLVENQSNVVADALSFGETTDFMEIEAAEYDFQLRDSGNDAVMLTIPDINLQSGYFYTAIIRGYVTPPGGNSNVLSMQIVVN